MHTYQHPANLNAVTTLRHLKRFTGIFYSYGAKAARKSTVIVRCVPGKRRVVLVEDYFPPSHDEIDCYPQYAVVTVHPASEGNQPIQKPCHFQIFYQHDSKLPDNKYALRKFDTPWKGSILVLALKKRKINVVDDWAPRGLENCDVGRWAETYEEWLDAIIKGLIDVTETDESGEKSTPRYFSIRIPS